MLSDLTNTDSEWGSAIAPPWPLRRFTVAQYEQLGQLGILTPEDHVELLEGWIVEKTNHGPMHGSSLGSCPIGCTSKYHSIFSFSVSSRSPQTEANLNLICRLSEDPTRVFARDILSDMSAGW